MRRKTGVASSASLRGEEEADALDEYYTKNLPKVDPSKGGITTRQGFRMVALDSL